VAEAGTFADSPPGLGGSLKSQVAGLKSQVASLKSQVSGRKLWASGWLGACERERKRGDGMARERDLWACLGASGAVWYEFLEMVG